MRQAVAVPVALLVAVALLAVVARAVRVDGQEKDVLAGAAPASGSAAANVEVKLVQTAQKTLDRLTPKPSLTFKPISGNINDKNQFFIEALDPTARFQTILGFGGAFTEAASLNFAALNPTLQHLILEAYWGQDGIGYSIGRVHMNSCLILLSHNHQSSIINHQSSIINQSHSHNLCQVTFAWRATTLTT